MADVFSSKKRSEVMSKIKNKNTKIEVMVGEWLSSFGYLFKLNDKSYPGAPDIILPDMKTAIFINGCFWHAHENCKYSTIPKTRTEFWKDKLSGNVVRDKLKMKELESQGWNVLTIWECELKNDPSGRLIRLLGEIRGQIYE